MTGDSDVEALRPPADGRAGCLRACLAALVAALFVWLLGVTLTVTLTLMKIQRELPVISTENPLKPTAPPQSARHDGKAHRSAILKPQNEHLENVTIPWDLHPKAGGVTYDQKTRTIQVEQNATYLLYLNLGALCRLQGPCSRAMVVIRVLDRSGTKLNCEVELSPGKEPVWSNKCLAVLTLGTQDSLLVDMTVTGGFEDWKLSQEHSRLGLLLMDKLGK